MRTLPYSIQSVTPAALVVNTTDTELRPTYKTSLLELKRESESNLLYLPAMLVASFWDSPDRALSIKAWVAIQQFSGFNAIITDAANKASVLTGYPVLPFLVDQSAPRGLSIDQSEIAQICIFNSQYSVCTWLETLGIYAHAVVGHNLGEIAAAGMIAYYVAGFYFAYRFK
jgi:hypothetical protein